jgi:hypothetical protein
MEGENRVKAGVGDQGLGEGSGEPQNDQNGSLEYR